MFSPPLIPDFSALVAERLREKIPQRIAWWPGMASRDDPVEKDYAHSGNWLRVEVYQYELAPPPMRTVFARVNVSLRGADKQVLWEQRKTFSGVVHGGEKIDVAKLPGDASQLKRELERAAEWLASEFVSALQ